MSTPCVSLGEYSFVGTDGARHYRNGLPWDSNMPSSFPTFPQHLRLLSTKVLFFFIGWYLYEISSLIDQPFQGLGCSTPLQATSCGEADRQTWEVNETKKRVVLHVFLDVFWRSVGWWTWWCYCCYCVKRLTVLLTQVMGDFQPRTMEAFAWPDELCLSDWWSNMLSF